MKEKIESFMADDIKKMKKKKLLKIIIISVIMVGIILVILNIKLYFRQINLINYPQEITKYSFNGTIRESKVDNINVVESKNKIGVKTEYCEINLSDNYCKRTVYICLVSKYNGKGEWILENWTPYADEVIENISNN